MTLENFFDQEIEPEAICGNCQYHAPTDRGQICCNGRSPHYNKTRKPEQDCNRFFPCPERWPDADHG